jgi:hypothetical protein
MLLLEQIFRLLEPSLYFGESAPILMWEDFGYEASLDGYYMTVLYIILIIAMLWAACLSVSFILNI